MRVVFVGTAAFAQPALAAVSERHEIPLVVTQPDRPVGRHADLTPPPIKVEAERLGLDVFQPERINRDAAIERLRQAGADVFVVAAYGQLLKPTVFAMPPRGTINIHASLLPAYRGGAPIQWAIIRGETTTGISTFYIEAGMDTGDVLLRRELAIDPDETAGELEPRLAALGAETILETLDGLDQGDLEAVPQPDEGVSTAPLMSRETGRIDWTLAAQRIHDLVRGTNPWPSAWTTLREERIKIHRSARTGIKRGAIAPGEIALAETGRLLVGCADELVEIREIQREGRPRTDGAAFLHGLHGASRFA